MKRRKIFLLCISILCCACWILACRMANQPKDPSANTPEIIDTQPFSADDDLSQKETDQLSKEEKPQTQENYQAPTRPIFLEPMESLRPKLYNIDKKWKVIVSKEKLLQTLSKMKVQVLAINPIIVDTKDEQGCCSIISIGGKLVNAYELCVRLNLPSSYLTDIEIDEYNIIFEGQGCFEPDGC